MGNLIEIKNGQTSIFVKPAEENESIGAVSALDDAIKKVEGALSDKFSILESIGATVKQSLKNVDASSAEVEFGLDFSAKGTIYIAEAEGSASLKVKLVFDNK